VYCGGVGCGFAQVVLALSRLFNPILGVIRLVFTEGGGGETVEFHPSAKSSWANSTT
jgi:hypothetical protein